MTGVHPVAVAGRVTENVVTVSSPRDEQEVNVIFALLQAAYRSADGRLPEPTEIHILGEKDRNIVSDGGKR